MAASKKGPGRGRLPEAKNLLNKTPDQLISTLNRFGIDPDLSGIAARSKRAWSRLERLVEEGIEPDEAMWDELNRQHEREMTQNLRKMTKSAIRNYKLDKAGSGRFMWLTVGDDRVCKSCEPRHGKVKTLAQWRATGLPGSSGLVCSEECRCQLLPTS